MFLKKRVFAEPLLALVLFCSPDLTSTNQPDVHPGMRKIYSADKTFMQGASDSAANADEKPPVACGFTYDFWLDSALVTQKEFFEITGKRPVSDTSAYGRGDDYPVYNVSWFDAILFCNAKSRKEKLDTVYSYFGAPQAQQGGVYGLGDVHAHYERNGYRLPTESEWEFAAREGTSSVPFPHLSDSAEAQSYAWYSSNSSGKTHPVASLMSNALGLYDMAGNVFEWTGDWKGFYTATQIVNSIGAAAPDNANERVVKGGSFMTGFSSIRPSRRSAIYETSQSTAVAYIGFRCAQGVIPSPSYLSVGNGNAPTNPTFLVSGDALPFLGTRRARLVFVNVTSEERTLCYVDFGRIYPVVFEMKDFTSVNKPVISPDGKYAAFSTGREGMGGSAATYIRNLDSIDAPPVRIPSESAFDPRWWVDPVSLDTFLLFTNSAVDNASAQWLSSGTFMIKTAGGKPAGPVRQLNVSGSFHDGRSYDGRYLVSGYTRLLMHDMTTGQDRQLFVPPYSGKGPTGSTQACNASICPDPLFCGRCLFLDFGCGGQASLLTGTKYGVHEYIFIADYCGLVSSWFGRPQGEESWDYPQWSTAGRYAVACGRGADGDAHAIYFVNIQDSAYCRVVEGTELASPSLWVDDRQSASGDSLDLDSLGNYDDPPLNANLGEFTRRMHDFWKKHDEMQVVFVGSSHTENAVDPRYFTGVKVSNMAFGGCPFFMWPLVIENYLINQCPALQFVGCDVVPGIMDWGGYFTQWPNLQTDKGFNYDKNHHYWKNGLPANFENLIQTASCPDIPLMDTLGLFHLPCNGWGGGNPDVPDSSQLNWGLDNTTFQESFSIIKELARFLAERKIHFCMYFTPENPAYRGMGSYGLYGPSRETARAVVATISALQDTFPGYVHFYDANIGGYHDYADSEASNVDHLCPAGARKFSVRMDSLIHAVLGR